jgi:hypothetical protein
MSQFKAGKNHRVFHIIALYLIFFCTVCFLRPALLSCASNDNRSNPNPETKTQQWFQKPMRIAALQCNFENGKTLEVVDKWINMGFNVEQLFHPMADDYSALYDPAIHRDILKAYLAKAKKNNLKIILYLTVHVLGPSLMKNKEIWSQRNSDDEIVMLYNTYPSVCLNSPWREYFFKILDSLKEMDIDGVFLDGPVISKGCCFCKFCKEKNQAWLQNGLGSYEFNRRTRDDFLMEAYAHFKQLKPEGIFYINLPLAHPTPSFVDINTALNYNDIVGTEGGFFFYGPPKNRFLWRPSFTSKLLEATAPDKPRVIFMSADQKRWSWYLHTPVETRLCIASCVANAANMWWGLCGSTGLLKTETGDAARDIFQFLNKNEAFYDKSESIAKVGLLYSYASERVYNTSHEETDFSGELKQKKELRGNLQDAIYGFYDMLVRSQIPFDVITDLPHSLKSYSKYNCIILPSTGYLPPKVCQALRDFVKTGGNLIAGFDCTLYDSTGKKQSDFVLSDIFGISHDNNYFTIDDWNYFQPDQQSWLFSGINIPLYPAPLQGIGLKIHEDAQVLARYLEPLPGRYVPLTLPDKPFIIQNTYGRGECLFLAGTFGEMYNQYNPNEYRKILTNAVKKYAAPVIKFDKNYGPLEVIVREHEQYIVLHLVNYNADMIRPMEKIWPLYNVSFTLNYPDEIRNVRSLTSVDQIQVQMNKQQITITLPEVNEYEVLVLEK